MINVSLNKNENPNKKPISKKKIISNIIDWTLIILAVGFAAFVFIFASKNPTSSSQASIFGKQTLLVVSGSMDAKDEYYQGKDYRIGKIPTGSLIFIDCAPANDNKFDSSHNYTAEMKQFIVDIKIGDILTFTPETGANDYITHRVVNKYEVEVQGKTKVRFETRGDVADSLGDEGTEKFYAENIIGKVSGVNHALGWMYQNVFSNKILMIVIIIAISGSIIIYEVVKIIKIVREDKLTSKEENNKND